MITWELKSKFRSKKVSQNFCLNSYLFKFCEIVFNKIIAGHKLFLFSFHQGTLREIVIYFWLPTSWTCHQNDFLWNLFDEHWLRRKDIPEGCSLFYNKKKQTLKACWRYRFVIARRISIKKYTVVTRSYYEIKWNIFVS